MSASTYRDYCNEEVSGGKKRPIISDPIPLSVSYSRLPYADGGTPSPSPSRENLNMMSYPNDESYNTQPTLERSGSNMATMSSPTDTVDTVIHRPVDGASNLTYDTPLHRSVGNFEPMIRPDEPLHPPPQDLAEEEIHPERNSESQKLMNHGSTEKMVATKTSTKGKLPLNRARSYSPGSCCYCVSNMSCIHIFLWISMVIALIGWAIAIWMSIDSMQFMSHFNIRDDYTLDGFPFTDMTIIVIACATLLFSIAFLVISSYTSESLSSYHLPSSQMNKCAYCFTIAMTVFSCIAVVLWTLIVAVTMIPTTAITLIHLLYSSGAFTCIHLPSYGITNYEIPDNDKDPLLQLHCDDDLEKWLKTSWDMMTPLLCSLGCAILIEVLLMGFIIVISSNGRHLYERMAYLTNPKDGHESKEDKSQRQPFI